MENPKYLSRISDEEYREEFRQKLMRIDRIPHISKSVRQDLLNDLIVRYDRKNEKENYLIEGLVTRRAIRNAWKVYSNGSAPEKESREDRSK